MRKNYRLFTSELRQLILASGCMGLGNFFKRWPTSREDVLDCGFPAWVGCLYKSLLSSCSGCSHLKLSWVELLFLCRDSFGYPLNPDSAPGSHEDFMVDLDLLAWHRMQSILWYLWVCTQYIFGSPQIKPS